MPMHQRHITCMAGVHTSTAFLGRRNGGRFSPPFFRRSELLRRVSYDVKQKRPVPAGLPVT